MVRAGGTGASPQELVPDFLDASFGVLRFHVPRRAHEQSSQKLSFLFQVRGCGENPNPGARAAEQLRTERREEREKQKRREEPPCSALRSARPRLRGRRSSQGDLRSASAKAWPGSPAAERGGESASLAVASVASPASGRARPACRPASSGTCHALPCHDIQSSQSTKWRPSRFGRTW